MSCSEQAEQASEPNAQVEPIEDLLHELGHLLDIAETNGTELCDVAQKLREHPLYENVRNWL